jgi:hypothetical protein
LTFSDRKLPQNTEHVSANYLASRLSPTFISGYHVNGQPIRSIVRIASLETVEKIEADIQAKEIKEIRINV